MGFPSRTWGRSTASSLKPFDVDFASHRGVKLGKKEIPVGTAEAGERERERERDDLPRR